MPDLNRLGVGLGVVSDSRVGPPVNPRGNKSDGLVLVLVCLTLGDALLYPAASSSSSLFKLSGFRITDLLASVVCVGFFLVPQWRKKSDISRVGRSPMLGFVLVVVAVLWGLASVRSGIPKGKVLFSEWQPIVYLAAFGVLTGGYGKREIDRLLRGLRFVGFVFGLGGILFVASGAVIGSDFASVYACVAAVGLYSYARNDAGERSVAVQGGVATVCAVVLLVDCGQRAALVFTFTSLLFAWALVVPLRERAPGSLAALSLGLGIGAAALYFLLNSPTIRVVRGLVNEFNSLFYRQAKVESAESRVSQLHASYQAIENNRILGLGFGQSYTFYDPGTRQLTQSTITHDIATDFMLRFGLLGAGLLMTFAAYGAFRTALFFKRSGDRVALGLLIVAMGLFGKGLVESIIDKPRISLLFALILVLIFRRISGGSRPPGGRLAMGSGIPGAQAQREHLAVEGGSPLTRGHR